MFIIFYLTAACILGPRWHSLTMADEPENEPENLTLALLRADRCGCRALPF